MGYDNDGKACPFCNKPLKGNGLDTRCTNRDCVAGPIDGEDD